MNKQLWMLVFDSAMITLKFSNCLIIGALLIYIFQQHLWSQIIKYFYFYSLSYICIYFVCLLQVETIGDAYCVAAGLHRKSLCHAKPIALMALKMMELSEEVLTPDGRPIQVSLSTILFE